MFYGTVEGTIIRSGIEAMDLDFKDGEIETKEEKFESHVEDILIKAKEYIDFFTNNSFDEDRSPMVDDIAERIGSRMLNIATRDQTNQITNVEEFNVQLIDDVVLTDSIKADLKLLPSGSDRVKGRGDVHMGIVKDEDDFDFFHDFD